MLNKLMSKIIKRLGDKNRLKKSHSHFIKNNKLFWQSQKTKRCHKDSKKIVLVEVSEKNPFELESNMRVAKTVEKIKNLNIIVLLSASSKFNEPYYKLVKSYLISKVILFSLPSLKKALYFAVSFFEAIGLFRSIKNLADIEGIKYKDITIGDLIYDAYIRFSNDKYSPEKDFMLFKYIVSAIFKYKVVSAVFDDNSVEYLIVADKCYLNHGVLYRVAVQRGIKTLMPTKELKFLHKDNVTTHFYHPEISLSDMAERLQGVDFDKEVESYFKKRFSGNINEIDVLASYKDKKIYSKSSIEKILSLDKHKQNVVIMPHAFSDFPHIANGLYCDYYVWLVNLLQMVKELDNVNWVIKPHPTSYMFNESGVIENLLGELNINNVKIVPNDMNTATIKDFADVILTVRGTAGLEFATFGIPVVTAGDGCYSGYGIDISSVSKSVYEKTIKNLDKVVKLDKDTIHKAKMVFYYLFIKKNAKLNYLMDDFSSNHANYDNILLNIVKNNEVETMFENVLYKETVNVLQ